MKEPTPTGLNPSNSVDQTQKATEETIAYNLNQAGHNVRPEDVSAKPKFPTDLIEEIGGEAVDEIHDATEFIRATTEGTNYARTTDSKRPISITSLREKLKNLAKKKAA